MHCVRRFVFQGLVQPMMVIDVGSLLEHHGSLAQVKRRSLLLCLQDTVDVLGQCVLVAFVRQ